MKKIYFLFISLIFFTTAYSQSYLGMITKQVNFREGPGKDYKIIASLKVGTQIFIVSLDTENEFYNIIDIKSNLEGYIHKSFVKIGKLVNRSTESVFTPNGESTSNNPEVKIHNNTSKTLTLKMNSQIFNFTPQETKNITLSSGSYDFRASAPGVIPYIGDEFLQSNQSYSWQFYITTH